MFTDYKHTINMSRKCSDHYFKCYGQVAQAPNIHVDHHDVADVDKTTIVYARSCDWDRE